MGGGGGTKTRKSERNRIRKRWRSAWGGVGECTTRGDGTQGSQPRIHCAYFTTNTDASFSSLTSDIAVLLGRFLIHLHGLHAVVVFRRQLLQDKVAVLVRPHKVSRCELVRRDQTGHRKINRLPKSRPVTICILSFRSAPIPATPTPVLLKTTWYDCRYCRAHAHALPKEGGCYFLEVHSRFETQ